MYRVIALDLDGTLLNSKKELSEVNRSALSRAAAQGVEIVPTTGRFFDAMPDVVRSLKFINYAITVNGAEVYDIRNDAVVYRADIPYKRGVEIMEHLDTLPVIYDCYMDGWGWMTRAFYEAADQYVLGDARLLEMIRSLRKPVDELKTFVLEKRRPLQKIQMFFQDLELRNLALQELPKRFPDMAISSSSINNIEINSAEANKGTALCVLCETLGISASQSIAFGDGLNDIAMLRAAGVGVAMENAIAQAKAAADIITGSCDDNGVAQLIDQLLFDNNATKAMENTVNRKDVES